MKFVLLLFYTFLFSFVLSQKIDFIQPPYWWAGMKFSTIEILVKGKNIANYLFELAHPTASLDSCFRTENPNYIILQVRLKDTPPGKLRFRYKLPTSKRNFWLEYELKPRNLSPNSSMGIDHRDFIYLITPDRFVNGNPKNDSYSHMNQKGVFRDSIIERHGGDLAGVISKLDYIQDLGATAIWLNPIEENDQSFQSYHGYGITNHYRVDPRLGTMEEYRQYVQLSKSKGLKVVKDVVYNHVGDHHFLWKDKISDSWFHPKIQNNYRATTLIDPYASKADRSLQQNGWFADVLPDLNQSNPRVRNYLLQYSLWWIEEFGIDAYRIDTYAYPDYAFNSHLLKTILDEYPKFTIFSEIWETGEPTQAYFNSIKGLPYDIGTTDFEFQYALMDMANEHFGWNTGLAKMYYTLCFDYLYKDPWKHVTFMDNHDIDRYMGVISNREEIYKLAITMLLTLRGIPQWYYGAEIGMNQRGHHGNIRADFPGGWSSDKVNKFLPSGRNEMENRIFNHLRTLAQWRKQSPAMHEKNLTQFVPQDNVYVYFRTSDKEKVMVIINRNEKSYTLDLKRFRELLPKNITAKNILSGEEMILEDALELAPLTSYVWVY